MDPLQALLDALPAPPFFSYDWNALNNLPGFKSLFDGMARTPQQKEHHGEGDVMTHTKLVCEALARLADFRALPPQEAQPLALAALLHDIGKISATRLENGVLRAPRHGPIGAQLARTLLWTEYGLSGSENKQRFREAVCLLIRYHTQPLHLFEKTDAETQALKLASTSALAPAFTWKTLCLLSQADVMGRIADDIPLLLENVQLTREAAKEADCYAGPYPFPSPHTARALFSGSQVWKEQDLFDPAWGEVILLCGLPGTGKDTWIQANHPEMPVVCLDDIRRELKIKSDGNQGLVVQRAKEQAREYLRKKQPFIWNATSLTEKRAEQISLFERYGARVRIVYLETGWDENLRRNKARPSAVPEHVISEMLNKLEPPLAFEAQRVEWQCT